MLSDEMIAAIVPVAAMFEKLGVAYYIGGSVASSVQGIPRTTLDVDMVADLAAKHVAPLIEALKKDYYISSPAMLDAIARHSCFNLIHLATSFKIDVFVVKNRSYDQAALKRVQSRILGAKSTAQRFFYASSEDIVLAKLEWYRLGNEVSERQWRDVIGVLKVGGATLDRDYMRHWAGELGIADLLEKAWKEVGIE